MTPSMILLDLTHTSHTRARTGVQRVCRSLQKSLQALGPTQAITHDPYEKRWRPLRNWEFTHLQSTAPAQRRSARWPWLRRIEGQMRCLATPASGGVSGPALIVPEIFSSQTASAFPDLFTRVSGPRVALFHDAIALKYPELTPAKTVARFPAYLRDLLAFDAIAAVSEDSRQTLLDYWAWLGIKTAPLVQTIPLGVTAIPAAAERQPAPQARMTVLSVGSIEGRKNHLGLLEACEKLWAEGVDFELRLIGLAHPETGQRAVARIAALQRAGRPLRYDGPVAENELEQAYAACAFTVYPSLMEGFGLPVLESVYRQKPCICSGVGALGDAARGGGCVITSVENVAELAEAIKALVTQPEWRKRLAVEAAARSPRTESDHARDLLTWINELRVRFDRA